MSPKAGNSCLFFLQRIANILLTIVSLGFIGVGGYLFWLTQNPGVFEITFLVLGVLEFLFSLIGLSSKNSKTRMLCFLWVLGFLCLIQIITATLGFIFEQKILNWAGQNQSSDQEDANNFENVIKDHVNIALIAGLAASGVQVVCFLFTWFYVCSMHRIKGRHAARLASDAYSGLDYNALLEEKQNKDKDEVRVRYDDKKKQFHDMLNNRMQGEEPL